MNVDGFKEQLQEQGVNLAQEHRNITSKNSKQYEDVKSETESKAQVAEQQVEKYEEDRIGKGRITSRVAK